MILSGETIKKMSEEGNLIEGFDESRVQPASYDLTKGDVDERFGDQILKPGEYRLVSTKEKVNMPNNIAALCKTKSSFSRMGIATADFGCWIDPGFCGNITLAVFNFGDREFDLSDVDAICQIIFAEIDDDSRSYDGHYQDSDGITECRIYKDSCLCGKGKNE